MAKKIALFFLGALAVVGLDASIFFVCLAHAYFFLPPVICLGIVAYPGARKIYDYIQSDGE